MLLRKSSFVLMMALLWTSTLLAQQPKQMSVMGRPQTVAVPDFRGKTLQQAQAEAVVPGTAKPLFLGIYPQGPAGGVVASQTPAAHTPVIPGSTRLLLTLDVPKPSAFQTFLHQIVSSQQKMERVPQLDGDSRDVASRLLQAAHLKGAFTGDMGGVVTQQSPPAGKSVEPGSTVIVTLALPQVIVPSLYGMTVAQATQTLGEASLQRGTIDGENTEEATVTSQSPTAGTHVPPDTAVAVSVSPAQQPVPPSVPPVIVPNLAKMNGREAAAALASVGLRTGHVKGPPTGFVSDQAPTGGNTVEAGTSVDFTLVAATVVVPDVMKDSEAVAEERLKVFSLQPKISRAKDWNANAVHVVVEQRPSAGTNVDLGSAIDVVIGNVTPPPPTWRRVLGQVVTALPLAPWWIWLAIGVPLGAVAAGVIKKVVGQKPKTAHLTPPAACTLTATRTMAKTLIRPSGGPTVEFTLGLRDSEFVARCRVESEPAVRRKG
jgi:beta-lactam-binding protein with PASTA domain